MLSGMQQNENENENVFRHLDMKRNVNETAVWDNARSQQFEQTWQSKKAQYKAHAENDIKTKTKTKTKRWPKAMLKTKT